MGRAGCPWLLFSLADEKLGRGGSGRGREGDQKDRDRPTPYVYLTSGKDVPRSLPSSIFDFVPGTSPSLEIRICGSKPMSDQEILAAPAVRRLGRAGLEALPRSGPLR